MTPAALVGLCHEHMSRRLAEMDDAPEASILLEAAAVAEILAIAVNRPSLRAMQELMSRVTCRWLQCGLLEHALMSGAQNLYPVSLLIQFATKDPAFRHQDLAVTRALVEAGIVGRTELPILTLALVAALLRYGDVDFNVPVYSLRGAQGTFDKRVMRARTDEYDVSTLLMVAQLAIASEAEAGDLPVVLPQIMLVQAMRAGHANWLAVLSLLHETVFAVSEPVRAAGRAAVGDLVASLDDLVPLPPIAALQNDYVERVPLGLRLRSSIACCAVLDESRT